MRGKIVKGIAGFYYVDVGEAGIYECKAKGIFRKENIKPLVGDDVEISVTDEGDKEGNVDRILERRNVLIRPAVANVDQVLVVFAAASPDINFHLLNRYLIWMEHVGVRIRLLFNKCELVDDRAMDGIRSAFVNTGYDIRFISVKEDIGIDEVIESLKGSTSALSGPSGVGKSSLINRLCGEEIMETGGLSRKLSRGKHTTRHTELFKLAGDTYILDTPGFSSMELAGVEKEKLFLLFPEMAGFDGRCRFAGCSHISEPDCAVRSALADGGISEERYEDYTAFYEEIASRKRY